MLLSEYLSASNKMAEILLGGKRLSELKVTELKEELDSRGLSKKGVKTVLITRLKNAILKEELEVLCCLLVISVGVRSLFHSCVE